jgi:2,5-diamino-6-(ribosylamino)-4(3H)-pyrimidinone 5'-phosphate reductase
MRPHVTVNCAMTADGKLAGRRRKQVTISSPEDLARVKKLRKDIDAILVGIGTVLSDDPHLTVKGSTLDKNPIRVILDSRGRTPDDAGVLDGQARTIIVTVEDCDRVWGNAEVLRIGKNRVDLDLLLAKLHEMGVRTLLVEGGGEVLWSFFKGGLVDHYSVFVGSMILGGRTAPTPVDGEGFDDHETMNLKLVEWVQLGGGVLLEYEVCNDGE